MELLKVNGQWVASIQDCSKIGTFQPPATKASTLFLHLACFEDYKQYSQHEEQIKDICPVLESYHSAILNGGQFLI